jgi:ABC-type bacteriocin/lantibiotic exporter with double-glycine peptidase domain
LISNPTQRTLKTTEDGHGVCVQSTPYNCGPAAAVTALRKLGFTAEEGELGLLFNTTVLNGTPDDLLVEGLRKKYGPQGLKVEWRYVKSVDELRTWPVSLAVIKYNMFVDHYVAVLGFEGDKVVVGDPLSGIEREPTEAFLETWHHVAIMMRRE